MGLPPMGDDFQTHGREDATGGTCNRMSIELDSAQIRDVWGYFLSEEILNGGWFTQEDRDGLLKYLEQGANHIVAIVRLPIHRGDGSGLPITRGEEISIQLNEWEHTYIQATKLNQQRDWSFTESKITAYANRTIKDSCADFFKLHAIICHQIFSKTQQSGPSKPKSESAPGASPLAPSRSRVASPQDLRTMEKRRPRRGVRNGLK
ncbi:uncharacterized protein DFL_003490 [Arthrobotrys flagrans]|uniref:Uncharacterized protein n=1 Tax=Arthrobotrys flagrans TaxID=97331 RepID=A0A437A1Y9_ARTFL|nr:hypothetical protein DFL_003490 [Arthrobotrys flagrans]